MKSGTDSLLGSARQGGRGEHWLTISDLMAGLMVVFLFISIALMRSAFLDRDRIREIAVTYRESQVAINQALQIEFKNDLKRWDAEIGEEDLTFEFKSPEVLFEAGSTALRSRFASILNDFFPRYLAVLLEHQQHIDEVRVEGHTSSEWEGATDDDAYFLNMQLSQGRTRSVLEYIYWLTASSEDRSWVKRKIAAVGLSSSRHIKNHAGIEDRGASRRVLFRVVTNAEIQIRTILEIE